MGKADKRWAVGSCSYKPGEKRLQAEGPEPSPSTEAGKLGVYWIPVSHSIWLEPGRRGGKSQELHSGRQIKATMLLELK